jgi:lipopolysaccharide assembly protein A
MSSFTNLIISTIAAVWIVTIALVSVQNASIVNLKFLFWQSIDLPWGFVLAGAVGVGFVLGGWLSFIVSSNSAPVKRR